MQNYLSIVILASLFGVALTAVKDWHLTEFEYLDIKLSIITEDEFLDGKECNIIYTLYLIPPLFFEEVFRQDGVLTQNSDELDCGDNTIIRVTDEMSNFNSDIYLWLTLSGVPDDIQDFMIVKISNVIRTGKRLITSFGTRHFFLQMDITKRFEPPFLSENLEQSSALANSLEEHSSGVTPKLSNATVDFTGSCHCSRKSGCACCEKIGFPLIHLHENVCSNLTVIPQEVEVEASLSIGDHLLILQKMSLKKPKTHCVNVPYLRKYASICIVFYNNDLNDNYISACVGIEAVLFSVKVHRKQLGCFKFVQSTLTLKRDDNLTEDT